LLVLVGHGFAEQLPANSLLRRGVVRRGVADLALSSCSGSGRGGFELDRRIVA
jgi:hypothetical protein